MADTPSTLHREKRVIGACSNPLTRHDDKWYLHHSFGSILNLLSKRFPHLRYGGPLLPDTSTEKADCELIINNLEVTTWGTWRNTLHAMKHPFRLIGYFWRFSRNCDAILIRGMFPLIWILHWIARWRKQRIVHWIAANPILILRGDDRGYGKFTTFLGILFAYFERYMTLIAMRVSRGYVVTSGLELGRIFASKRTVACESSSTSSIKDFRIREDTCQTDSIRILFIGFIRAEKGIEYLIRALPLIESDRPIHLALVGGWDQFPTEHARLSKIIDELGLNERVHWEGYHKHGPALFDQIDRSDLLVLPSLSEGTPHVLIEARARSLPIVASRVGGIPGSVTDQEDGMLVEPKNSTAIANAISRIINDAELRRKLIRQGRERVSRLTIEWFTDLFADLLTREDDSLLANHDPIANR